jgi:hypothetical protein
MMPQGQRLFRVGRQHAAGAAVCVAILLVCGMAGAMDVTGEPPSPSTGPTFPNPQPPNPQPPPPAPPTSPPTPTPPPAPRSSMP